VSRTKRDIVFVQHAVYEIRIFMPVEASS
jgi:hypothetical protein